MPYKNNLPEKHFISAIVLAAGKSTRMGGRQKLLLQIGGKTIIEKTVNNLLKSRVDEIILVLGFERNSVKKIFSAYDDERLKIVINPDFDTGMGSSISAGLEKINTNSGAAMICLGDQPFIEPEVIDLLIDCYNKGQKGIVVPVSDKEIRGHPCIFSLKYYSKLKTIQGDIGARKIIESNYKDICFFKINSEKIITDIDSLEDYCKYNDSFSN
jgi:molybdenum cofactor cytidylyltransferase